MSRTNKDRNVSNRKDRTSKGNAKGNAKGNTSPAFKGIRADADASAEIRSLLSLLDEQRASKDRDAQKGTRRKLRSLGYWGGTRTRTNWIGRVPDTKRASVVVELSPTSGRTSRKGKGKRVNA